ncbi:LysR family transcriptional regulator [Roseivivax sp. CAU 1761]
MNWDDLRVFAAVARQGGITPAAKALALDTATVSRRIGRLEETLGTALFARSSRGVVVTDFGERVLQDTQKIETIAQDIVPGDGHPDSDLRGTVRIGAPDGCANFLLPQICADIQTANPSLCLEVIPHGRGFDLLRREVDIAVAVNPPGNKRTVVQPVAEYNLIFAAHRSLLGDGEVDLAGLPLAGYVPELLLDPGLDIPEEHRESEPMLRSSSVMVQWQWICEGRAAGLLHDFAFSLAPGLVRLLPEFHIPRSYYLVSRRKDGQLIDTLVEIFQVKLSQEIARLRARANDAAR